MLFLQEPKVRWVVVSGFNNDSFICLARGYKSDAISLGEQVGYKLLTLIRQFLYEQLHPNDNTPGSEVDINDCPRFYDLISVFHSAVATYFAPSDISGIGGMLRERIRATPAWRKGKDVVRRYDCVFVGKDADKPGFEGLLVARIRLLFSFQFQGIGYPCALVEWFERTECEPDRDTGMWMVRPEVNVGERVASVIHVDCILRGAHLLPICGEEFVPRHLHYSSTLDAFSAYYVNKYIDHHCFETIF